MMMAFAMKIQRSRQKPLCKVQELKPLQARIFNKIFPLQQALHALQAQARGRSSPTSCERSLLELQCHTESFRGRQLKREQNIAEVMRERKESFESQRRTKKKLFEGPF